MPLAKTHSADGNAAKGEQEAKQMALTVDQVIGMLERGETTGLTKNQIQEAMTARKGRAIGASVKVNPLSGVVVVYGIGRNPAPYYASQWEVILGVADEIRKACESDMASRGQDDERYAFYREANPEQRKAMTKVYREANEKRKAELLAHWRENGYSPLA